MQSRRWGALTTLSMAAAIGVSTSIGAVRAAAKPSTAKNLAAKKTAGGNSAGIAQGKGFLTTDGCTGCHKLGGKGGTTGPDLSHVGSRLTAAQIAAKIKNPKAQNPRSIMPASKRPDKQIAAEAAYLTSFK
jgi:cbb3-type cytochrome oxidase cytochrome c subunit